MKFQQFLCRLFGHRWDYYESIYRTATTRYTTCTYLAGYKKRCTRCGQEETELYYPLSTFKGGSDNG